VRTPLVDGGKPTPGSQGDPRVDRPLSLQAADMVLPPALRNLLVPALAVAGLGLAPTAASAYDLSVSPTGANSGACAQKTPCKTIAYALSKSADGDHVVLRDGTYNEQVTLPKGRWLVAAAGATPVVDGGAGTAITMGGERTRVSGLHVRGDAYAILISTAADGATITGNVFDDTALNPNAKVGVGGASPAITVTGNQFVASPAGGKSLGLFLNTKGPVDVADNTFSGFHEAVTVVNYDGAPATVRHNTITGVHGDNGQGFGVGVYGNATVADNAIASIGGTGSTNPSYGISFREDATVGAEVPSVGVTRRNRITGFGYAAIFGAVRQPGSSLTSDGDVVTGNADGITVYGHGTVIGATIYDITFDDVYLGASSDLTVRSSIIEDGIVATSFPKPTCTITTSRGPTTTGDGTGCDAFQTSADPAFVGGGDYRLAAGSPLIDAGDPAAPAAGEVDVAGTPRAVAASAATACAPRRDIGAYEFVPATPFDCPAPPPLDTHPDPAPEQTPPTDGPGKQVLSPPAVNVGVVVLDDSAKRLSVTVDGGKTSTLAAHAATATRLLPVGPHTVRVTLAKGKPVTAKLSLKAGQLGAIVATVKRGKVILRTVSIAAGARRLVSLAPAAQKVRIGTAKKAKRLAHGAFATLPKATTTLTIGTKRSPLAASTQLTVLVPKGRKVTTVARHA